jgi:hypothetical protein
MGKEFERVPSSELSVIGWDALLGLACTGRRDLELIWISQNFSKFWSRNSHAIFGENNYNWKASESTLLTAFFYCVHYCTLYI